MKIILIVIFFATAYAKDQTTVDLIQKSLDSWDNKSLSKLDLVSSDSEIQSLRNLAATHPDFKTAVQNSSWKFAMTLIEAHTAAAAEVLDFLITHYGLDPNVREPKPGNFKEHYTPLLLAAEDGNIEVLNVLLAHHANAHDFMCVQTGILKWKKMLPMGALELARTNEEIRRPLMNKNVAYYTDKDRSLCDSQATTGALSQHADDSYKPVAPSAGGESNSTEQTHSSGF
jgi:hypothetical protein